MHCSEMIIDQHYHGLNPFTFGYEDCSPGHAYGPAIRTHWLLHYVISGKGIFRRENVTYTVKSGDIFVIPPFYQTYYEANRTNPWHYVWIGFTTDESLPKLLEKPVIHCPEAERIFNEMRRCHVMSGGKSAFLCGKLWELMSLFLEQESPCTDYVTNAINLIHSEYMNGITVHEIADRFHIDRSYFYSLFKQKTGVSPKQYLLHYRMNQAAALMTINGYSATVAARSVGYSDICLFSKIFKQVFGLSPRAYIQQYQETNNEQRFSL